MAPLVSIGGIHLVNSTGTPVAGGVATAAATTPFAVKRGWRPMPAELVAVYSGQLSYPDVSYGPVQETMPIVVIGSDHENAVARLQQLQRAILPANGLPALLEIQPTASSTLMQAEITNAAVRPVTEDESGFECWEGFSELHAEIVYTRSAFFGRPVVQDASILIGGNTFTNTGTGANPNIGAYPAGLDGDLANEGQPTWLRLSPGTSGAHTIFYVASVYSRAYSTTGAGAKTTVSTTGASSALNAPTFTAAQAKLGLKARVLFRFTNNTSNVRVRVEMRANAAGTLLYAGKWITPTAGVATLYDMGRIPLDFYRVAPGLTTGSAQLYIGYKSSDGASATATLGYSEFLLYWDFCQLDSPTPVNSGSGGSGYRLELYSYLSDVSGGRPMLPLDAPAAAVFDNTLNGPIDNITIRGRPPRAIEGGSLYLAMMTAGNVHSTTATATVYLYQAPLWRVLRGSD